MITIPGLHKIVYIKMNEYNVFFYDSKFQLTVYDFKLNEKLIAYNTHPG